MPAIMHQQCWNHEAREAVCRCPGCSRSYCRECVTEHQARLLCALCLRNAMLAAAPRRASGAVRQVLLLVAGLLIAWIFFLSMGGIVSEISERRELAEWRTR